ncbi:Fir1p NDAI_0B06050 [Naumovozyma dairenensis CBS 421]|uniref:Uncharacterized protein n=1 Tax=Naumovozyma dairenensis (strain ATCC 10597 / BCRC 20456 / CBS 421 / NBRC 0211 / NRRL Y-12639) TaxID=1071378 RepID=G0W776_NAUDC|nr:hypothetical protein NDAI_0B06050 [Naumovozyma dairenensis CBS 421]CCD23637.1 hypothetical protein NDAI_0B06050 [Naumovozyma dairenensis CBS 421]
MDSDELPLINPIMSNGGVREMEPVRYSSSRYSSLSSKKNVDVSAPHLQVRFAIPDKSQQPHSASYLESPSKIVYPNTLDDTIGKGDDDDDAADSHILNQFKLVDMSSKIMVEVPEDVWRFHTSRRTKELRLDNKENWTRKTTRNSYCGQETKIDHQRTQQRGHQKSKSVQEIIVDTMAAYNKKCDPTAALPTAKFTSNVSSMPLSKSPRANIYLTSESSINKYNVSIPLEISVPPYLSPRNKNKIPKCLVYDGQGYSEFHTNNDSPIENGVENLSESNESLITLESDSIPFATHTISFEEIDKTSINTDKILGIDKDANVSLREQNRNLRKLNKLKNQPLPSLPSLPHIPTIETGAYEETHQAMQLHHSPSPINNSSFRNEKMKQEQIPTVDTSATDALKVLATPTKLITIPDLNDEEYQTPKSRHSMGSLTFFEDFQPFDELSNQYSPMEHDLNPIFKFPASNDDEQQQQHGILKKRMSAENHDLKINQNMKASNPQSEKRRQKLVGQNVSPMNSTRIHRHKRSKSVIDAVIAQEDVTTSQEYLPTEAISIAPKVTPRSPLPPIPIQAASAPIASNSVTMNQLYRDEQQEKDSINPVLESSPVEKQLAADKTYGNTFQEDSFESPYFTSLNETTLSYENNSRNIKDTNNTNNKTRSIEDTEASVIFLYEQKVPQLETESHSTNLQDISKVTSTETKSIPGVSDFRPLSSFQSFSKPLSNIPYQYENQPLGISNNNINNNIHLVSNNTDFLSPRRQLSNVRSQSSSGNSQFSTNSYQTSKTSEPSITAPLSLPMHTIYDKSKCIPSGGSISSSENNHQPLKNLQNNIVRNSKTKTVLEQKNGKIVEVIVLDTEEIENEIEDANQLEESNRKSITSQISNISTTSSRQDAMKHYSEILKMCENTAIEAKNIIYQLFEEEKHKEIIKSHHYSYPTMDDSTPNTIQNMVMKTSTMKNKKTVGQYRKLNNGNDIYKI